jgi:hypothetical protein
VKYATSVYEKQVLPSTPVQTALALKNSLAERQAANLAAFVQVRCVRSGRLGTPPRAFGFGTWAPASGAGARLWRAHATVYLRAWPSRPGQLLACAGLSLAACLEKVVAG